MQPIIFQHSLYRCICVCAHVYNADITSFFAGSLLQHRGEGIGENEWAYMASILIEYNSKGLNEDHVLYNHHPRYAILRLLERTS